jgi:hypothetical protein
MVVPDADVRWYRGQGERWNTVIAAIVLTVLLDGMLIAEGITTPGARALSLTGPVLVCCAGCAVVILGCGRAWVSRLIASSCGTRWARST